MNNRMHVVGDRALLSAAPTARRDRPSRLVRSLMLLAVVAAAPSAWAGQLTATAAPSQGSSTSATVNLRIVIPESVRIEQGREQPDRSRQYTSRTLAAVDGRQVVTIARP